MADITDTRDGVLCPQSQPAVYFKRQFVLLVNELDFSLLNFVFVFVFEFVILFTKHKNVTGYRRLENRNCIFDEGKRVNNRNYFFFHFKWIFFLSLDEVEMHIVH